MDGFSVCFSPVTRTLLWHERAVFAVADLTGLPAPLVFGAALAGLGFAIFFGISGLARLVERRERRRAPPPSPQPSPIMGEGAAPHVGVRARVAGW